jgi:hypothetical protein
MLWTLRSLSVLVSVRTKIIMSNSADVSHTIAKSVQSLSQILGESELNREEGGRTVGASSPECV